MGDVEPHPEGQPFRHEVGGGRGHVDGLDRDIVAGLAADPLVTLVPGHAEAEGGVDAHAERDLLARVVGVVGAGTRKVLSSDSQLLDSSKELVLILPLKLNLGMTATALSSALWPAWKESPATL